MDASLDNLRKVFGGVIIVPEDTGYEEARKTFLHDKNYPACIVRPRDAADVAAAIAYAKKTGLALSVRSGGHSGSGYGTNDKGLVLDLSSLNGIEVLDAERRLVRLGSGTLWGDVAVKLADKGLGISSGDTRSVGVGGLTLGGGLGWMVRNTGLTIDSLIGAEVVTADGRVINVSEADYDDLFWAIRGGGGNVGVVTHFEFIAHPIGAIFGGAIRYELTDLPALLKGWRDSMRVAPEELNTTLLVFPSMQGAPPMAIVLTCYDGEDETEALQVLQPLLALPGCKGHDVKRRSYPEILEDPLAPDGVVPIVRNGFVREISDEVLAGMTEIYGKPDSPMLMLRSTGGAMNRIPADATAFAHRDSEALLVTVVFRPAGLSQAERKQALTFWERLKPYISGSYINFLDQWTEEDLHLAYPEATRKRLARIKKQYDPDNLFSQNYNIRPEN